ncbi:MAG: GTPase [Desulfosoma sp.]|uniref:GTPase n=1 Tax=Desulfosoma sp. TaxID=2603217 RepID=UPI00404B90CB
MPANLPPPYFEAEKRYREAKTPEAKIEALEEMLTIMPKHKGTDKLRADLRRKIAKFKSEARQKKGAGRKGFAYAIEKEGAAQVVVVGAPNVGKSSLVGVLSNASPEVAEFPHTTWKPTPGMVPYENIQFQLIDTPPISTSYVDSWMADLIRRADIVMILVDLKADPLQQMEDTVAVLQELRVFPEGQPLPPDLPKKPFLKKMIVVVNKVDTESDLEDFDAFHELSQCRMPCVAVSTASGRGLHTLLDTLFALSDVIRVYTKAPGKEPDKSAPFVLPKKSTLQDLAEKIHKDFVEKLKFAKIWGKAVFDGQMVQKDYELQDGDVVEFRI